MSGTTTKLNCVDGITSVFKVDLNAGIVSTLPAYINATTSATSKTSGALQVSGGVGITGDVYAQNIYSNGILVNAGGLNYTAGTNISISNSVINVVPSPKFQSFGVGNVTVSPPTGGSTLSLTLPSVLPASLSYVISDTSGNLSFSGGAGIGASSFSAQNNVSVPANVVGLSYTSGAFDLDILIQVIATTSITEVMRIYGVYSPSSGWILSTWSLTGDDTNTSFTINNSGQIMYTNINYPGFLSNTLSWTNSGSGGGSSTNTTTSTTTTSFSGSNGVSLGNITGLLFTGGNFDLNLVATITAASNLTQIFRITGILTSSGWRLNYIGVSGDDTEIIFDITSGGQIRYSSSNYIGFTGLTFVWTTTQNNTSLGSNLVSGVNTSGTPSSTGQFFNVSQNTFTDTFTAASGSLLNFYGSYIGTPNIVAVNTGVTTTNASTFYISGSPVTGSNETIANSYSLNVGSGMSTFGGKLNVSNTTTIIGSTSNVISTSSGAVSVNGDIHLYNGTSGGIVWQTAGTAPPTYTTRSRGTKLVLYPLISSTTVDYAIGVDTASQWYSVPNNSSAHRFYVGTLDIMDIYSNVVTVNVTTASTSTTTGALVVSGGLGVSGNIYGSNPKFSATSSVYYSFTSGILTYDSTVTNIGGGYSSSTYLFTAPVPGTYYFYASAFVINGVSKGGFAIRQNGSNGTQLGYAETVGSSTPAYSFTSASCIVTLSSGNTVGIYWGAGTISIVGGANFIGYLMV